MSCDCWYTPDADAEEEEPAGIEGAYCEYCEYCAYCGVSSPPGVRMSVDTPVALVTDPGRLDDDPLDGMSYDAEVAADGMSYAGVALDDGGRP